MADCPKCGFTQPDDQYCANCGVDMHSYQPEPEPITKRLSSSLTAQILVVLLVVSALFISIYVSQKEMIDQRLRSALETDSREVFTNGEEISAVSDKEDEPEK